MSGFSVVAKSADVPEGTLRVFFLGGRRVAVSRVEGKFYAMDDLCSHDEAPLGAGTLHGREVACPRHGARFDVTTGAAVRLPAVTPVRIHAVRVDGDDILVQLKD